jgi:putative MATE family efflux protein
MVRVKPPGLPDRAGTKVAKIAVPVGFEFFLVLALAFVNQIIVGGLGGSAIAAVGFANAIHTIPLFLFGALSIGAGVVVGRAFGGGNRSLTNRAVTYSVVLSLVTGVAVALPFVFFPDDIFRLAGASPQVVTLGSGYLAAMLASLPFGILATVLGSVLRSVNRSRSPMVATIVMVAMNVPLAIVLVYGWGPIPALGVLGAGIASLISMAARSLVLMVQVYLVYDVANWKLPVGRSQWSALGRPILRLAIPLGLTSLSWTVGNFLYNVIIQQLGDGQLAVLQIVWAFSGVFVVGSFGLASAITVLVSQTIGAGHPELATVWIKYLLRLGIITGVGFASLFALSSLLLPVFFPELSQEVLGFAAAGVLINSVIQPLSVRMILYGAVLPAGNDTTGIIIGDFSGPYLVGIPLTLILGFLTPLGVLGAIIGKGGEDIVKLLVFGYRSRRIGWDDVMRKHEESVIALGNLRTGPITVFVEEVEGDSDDR